MQLDAKSLKVNNRRKSKSTAEGYKSKSQQVEMSKTIEKVKNPQPRSVSLVKHD